MNVVQYSSHYRTQHSRSPYKLGLQGITQNVVVLLRVLIFQIPLFALASNVNAQSQTCHHTTTSMTSGTTLVAQNMAPALRKGIHSYSVILQEGDTKFYDASEFFYDPNGDALDYDVSWFESVFNLEFVSVEVTENHQFTLTGLKESGPRGEIILVEATDPGGLSAQVTIQVRVTDQQKDLSNRSLFVIGGFRSFSLKLGVGESISFSASDYFQFPDGESVNYEIRWTEIGYMSAVGSDNHQFTVTGLRASDEVTEIITVTARNPIGLSAELGIRVRVTDSVVDKRNDCTISNANIQLMLSD